VEREEGDLHAGIVGGLGIGSPDGLTFRARPAFPMGVRLPPFQVFLDEHREAVHRFLAAVVPPGDVDDCFQETFLSALRAYPRLRHTENLRGWVLAIAARKTLDARRGRARRPRPVAALPDRPGEEPFGRDPALWAAVRALPPRQRAAVALRYAGDLAYREVARIMGGSEAAARRAAELLGRRALGEDLVDVAYAFVDAPVGRLLVAATRRGLVRVALPGEPAEEVLAELARRVSPRVLEVSTALEEIRSQLGEYFAGRRRRFEVRLDWRLARGFSLRVLRATAAIPYGRVATYREVAARAGNPRATRAAGAALARNPVPIVVPCHRVLRTGGDLGGYGGGVAMKRTLLRLEGAVA
jgi:methylated-DNA-[protein]-cysteine S-methyltransferase